ncbi:MAG TPA: bifunctional 3,4-dihydroxy-2-butanone-4-phosphate synthase/GTP cyclohydrolase II [Chloroflexota bacterium]|nr:bifunctional 3,4-dihydroxy-2-butanone-4-phosphate synthase/GTP cyclohydrolase II [Chloroflexota bacterium]
MPLSSVSEAIEDIRQGSFVIVVDDEDRENEGDLVMAAELVTPQAVNFMAREARGLICVPLTPRRLDELGLPMMVSHNTAPHGTAFTVSVEAKDRVTTGISAYDRAATIRALVDPATRPDDLLTPGHTFPLRAREGGVLRRAGQTEAAVDLARLAGLQPAGVICEIMSDDGTMARLPELERFAARHGLRIISVAQLISYRRRHERLVRRTTEPIHLPTSYGDFQAIGYEDSTTGEQHMAIVKGEIDPDVPTLVRVHSECLTGDVFGSQRCDCGEQLALALRMIEREGGAVVYMRQHEGRGIGLHNKLRAYKLQEEGLDTVEANERLGFPPDMRDFGVGAEILYDLGIRKIRFLSNNPDKQRGIFGRSHAAERGLELVETVPLAIPPNEHNQTYLETKRSKLGHVLEFRERLNS